MASRSNSLSKIQTEILRQIILDDPNRRDNGLAFGYLYDLMDIAKYTRNEVRKGLDDLVKDGFIDKRGNEDVYFFSRDQFLETKSHFRNEIIWKKVKESARKVGGHIWEHIIVVIIATVLAAILSTLLTSLLLKK